MNTLQLIKLEKTFKLVLYLYLILVFTSCGTTQELRQKKIMRAQDKINKILLKYPEIKTNKDTTSVTSDTTIISRTKYIKDSIFIQGGTKIDTVITWNNYDSIFTAYSKNIELKLAKLSNGSTSAQVKVIPHYIREIDTIRTVDTIIKEKIVTSQITEINTDKSFWWSLWFNIKGWLWYVLVIITIVILVLIMLRMLKR